MRTAKVENGACCGVPDDFRDASFPSVSPDA